MISKCSFGNTQAIESFNSIKAKIAPKQIHYSTSCPIRMGIAVIKWNLPSDYLRILEAECCPDVINEEPQKVLDRYSLERHKDRNKSHDPNNHESSKRSKMEEADERSIVI